MTEDSPDVMVRRAIGGSGRALAWIASTAPTCGDVVVVAMDALLSRVPERLDRARSLAVTSRDRQLVEIIRAHLSDDHDLVDALARDHLVDFPDSYVAAWIASGAVIHQSDPHRDPEA